MLSIGGSLGLGPLAAPAWSQSRARETAAADARAVDERTASFGHIAPAFDRGAGFHIQTLSASNAELGAPPPCRKAVLAAYRAPLAGRIRYYGPLTPVDLRV